MMNDYDSIWTSPQGLGGNAFVVNVQTIPT